MLNSKDSILEEIKELEGIITMYKESFPDNPVFA